jgi:hypothetical protein
MEYWDADPDPDVVARKRQEAEEATPPKKYVEPVLGGEQIRCMDALTCSRAHIYMVAAAQPT